MEIYASKLYQKAFRGNKSKDTYLKACGWLAQNVISNEHINDNVMYNIEKGYDNETGCYLYVITIYAKMNKEEIKGRHCAICKEVNGSFLMNEEIKCDWCKLQAYFRREDEMIKEKKRFIKEKMSGGR